MTTIVHGVTGAQGAPVVQALEAAGLPVRGLSRAQGDLDDRAALAAAYEGATGAFIHFPITPDPAAPARWAANLAAVARPERAVISTSGGVPGDAASPFGASRLSALGELAERLRDAGVVVTVLAPRLFLENLLLPPVQESLAREQVLTYPVAAERPVAWSSHLDVADAAVAALTHATPPSFVDVGAVPGLSGADLAAQHGTSVTYRAMSPVEFGGVLAPILGSGAAAGIQGLYQAVAAHPEALAFTAETGTEKLLGVRTRSVRAWLEGLSAHPVG
ncbi:NmrA family NAD(P)-binding protein [Allokutzneria multivorans]|uniref:NmrA family NAD(P)-binding protein n=1 Tax=Allokutzneria multivorans TaxID=1142134 RepID=A0ABP7QTV3_9PSEU